MGITCTKQFKFCAAHRLYGHEGKCRFLHGHNYRVEVTATANQLDSVGRVVDFSVLKQEIGGWIDEHWDHATILRDADPLVSVLRRAEMLDDSRNLYVMHKNPTAENMATFLFAIAQGELQLFTRFNFSITRIRVYETDTCWAERTG